MTKEAMQQALDVLRHCLEHPDAEDAIAALEAAIAQPVQPAIRMPKMLRHPEPHTYTWTALEMKAIHEYGKACFDAGGSQPVQPPQRPWVGLTDEELLDIADLAYANDLELMHQVQDRLKEKNK